MPFERPTLRELVTRTHEDFISELDGVSTPLRYSISKVFSSLLAGASHLLHGHLDWLARQFTPKTAIENYLDRWGELIGVLRKDPINLKCEVVFRGIYGSPIYRDTKLRLLDRPELEFELENDVLIEKKNKAESEDDNVGAVKGVLSCLFFGSIGDVDVGSGLVLESPVEGVEEKVYVSSVLRYGEDTETDEELRVRVLTTLETPSRGGTLKDYYAWMGEVSGVNILRVWVIPRYFKNSNGVGILFTVDDTAGQGILPTDADVKTVQNYINTKRPLTSYVKVMSPIPLPITIEIQTEEVIPLQNREIVEAELSKIFKMSLNLGGYTKDDKVYINWLRDIITSALNTSRYRLASPIRNVDIEKRSLPILDKVIWTQKEVKLFEE